RERDGGGRGVAVPAVGEHAHVVGRQHLEGGDERGLGQRVRVPADVQRPGDPVAGPVVTDRLRGGGDVVLVERQPQRRAAVTGRAERYLLCWFARIRMLCEKRGDQ